MFGNQMLVSLINENEIGPVLFDAVNKLQTESKYLALFDFDLAENSTFDITLGQSYDNNKDNELSRLTDGQLTTYFTFLPSYIEGKNIFNLFNQKEFDFESLNLKSFIDSSTGVANKFIKFNVIKKLILFQLL
jgi:hypothetical protein